MCWWPMKNLKLENIKHYVSNITYYICFEMTSSDTGFHFTFFLKVFRNISIIILGVYLCPGSMISSKDSPRGTLEGYRWPMGWPNRGQSSHPGKKRTRRETKKKKPNDGDAGHVLFTILLTISVMIFGIQILKPRIL